MSVYVVDLEWKKYNSLIQLIQQLLSGMMEISAILLSYRTITIKFCVEEASLLYFD